MSSQGIPEDAGGIKKEVAQHSPTLAEWSVEGTNEAGKVSRLRSPGMDTNTFEPRGVDGQVELLPAAESSDTYSVEHRHRGTTGCVLTGHRQDPDPTYGHGYGSGCRDN